MRRKADMIRNFSLGLMVAVVAVLAPAQSALAQKIATIQINVVLDQLDEKTDKEGEMQSLITELENRVNGLGLELDAKQRELDVLPQSDPEYQTAAEDIIRRTFALRTEGEIAKALVEKKRKDIQIALFNKITAATGRYAKREGISIVLADDSKEEIPEDLSAQQAQGAILSQKVIWVDDSLDISNAVAAMMNNEYKAGN